MPLSWWIHWSDNDWAAFDEEWTKTLTDFGLRYFRMSEFAQSVGQFDSWRSKESKRRALLERLVNSIVAHTKIWCGATILNDDYRRVDSDYQLHEYAYRYPICGAMCVEKMRLWYDAHHFDCPIRYVFEEGDEHVGQLAKLVEKESGASISFADKSAPPLQAADFAAYELSKAYRAINLELDKLFEKFRTTLRLLHKVPSNWGIVEEKALRIFCRINDVPRRLSD